MGQLKLVSSQLVTLCIYELWLSLGGVSVFVSGRKVVSEYGSSTSDTHATWNFQIQICWLVPEGWNTLLWWGVVTHVFNTLQEVTIYSNVSMRAFSIRLSGPMGWIGKWVKNRVFSLLRKWEWRKTKFDSLWVRAVATQIFRFQEMYFLKSSFACWFQVRILHWTWNCMAELSRCAGLSLPLWIKSPYPAWSEKEFRLKGLVWW